MDFFSGGPSVEARITWFLLCKLESEVEQVEEKALFLTRCSISKSVLSYKPFASSRNVVYISGE